MGWLLSCPGWQIRSMLDGHSAWLIRDGAAEATHHPHGLYRRGAGPGIRGVVPAVAMLLRHAGPPAAAAAVHRRARLHRSCTRGHPTRPAHLGAQGAYWRSDWSYQRGHSSVACSGWPQGEQSPCLRLMALSSPDLLLLDTL